jgi:hypothetical protein
LTQPSPCPTNNNIPMHVCQDVRDIVSRGCWNGKNSTYVEQLLCTLNDIRQLTTVHFSFIGSTSYRSKQRSGKSRSFSKSSLNCIRLSSSVKPSENKSLSFERAHPIPQC